MGFWGVTKAVLTLGGSVRLENATARYERAVEAYRALRDKLDTKNQQIGEAIRTLKARVASTKSKFRVANKMIAPRCLAVTRRGGLGNGLVPDYRSSIGGGAARHAGLMRRDSDQLVALGAVSGASAAIVAWQGAQLVGIASTGTAMIGLHGAAASNAGWALFGGGSLATGGGGMALGHLVLPGAGVAIAIGVGAITSHREANRLNKASDELELVNNENKSVLSTVDRNLSLIQAAATRFQREEAKWTQVFRYSRKRLRRFGIFSVLYRFIRFKISGIYYTAEEWQVVQALEAATEQFFAAMSTSQR